MEYDNELLNTGVIGIYIIIVIILFPLYYYELTTVLFELFKLFAGLSLIMVFLLFNTYFKNN